MEHYPNPDIELKTATDSAELSEQALERAYELNAETFDKRIERIAETDRELASDLRLTVAVAEAVKNSAGEALVVGGFARDDALSRITGEPIESKDIDVEVYGVEFERLKSVLEGFGVVNVVGDHFAVAKLKNPETGHDLDFSIPRRDSKVDIGHKGFQVTGDPTMSILEAARRRDFTINALALNPRTGEVHDYFGGLDDLRRGVLRATDRELFADDPLRVLRAMQFAGRFEMTVDSETADLCRTVDLSELPRERIGEEWDKLMLKSERPSVGLEVARELGILDQLHPDLAGLDNVEQEPDWHPEGNVWNHTKLVADAAARVVREEGLKGDEAKVVLYGALLHDVGKKTTTELKPVRGEMRLTAHGHDVAGVEPAKRFLNQIYQDQAVIAKILPIIKEHLYHINAVDKVTGEFVMPSDPAIRRFAKRLHPASVRLYDLVSRCDSNGRGMDWEELTPSHKIYLRAEELNVSEKPLDRVVEGNHLEAFNVKKGPLMGRITDILYEAQIEGYFSDLNGALDYFREHQNEILVEAASRVEAETQRKLAEAQRRKDAEIAKHLDVKTKKQDDHRERSAQIEFNRRNKTIDK